MGTKILFFFTSSYPFGKGETFIESEINYLSKAYDKIIIISNDITSKQTREVPDNIILHRYPYELNKFKKIIAILNIFSPTFWQELIIIKKKYNKKLTPPIVNTMLQTMQKAKGVSKLLNRLTKDFKINSSIFLYSYWNNDMAFAIAKYSKNNPKITSFSRMHGWDTYFEVNEIDYLPFRNYIFNNINKVFAISQKGKDYYLDFFPKLQNKISISYLGTKLKGINSIKEPHQFTILTISNIIPVKNLTVLVKALNKLNINFKWIHIGTGYLFEELKKSAEQLIPNKYEFKGYMQNSRVLEFIKAQPIDLFANVSKSEGIPVSIMEAMSFGIPCMATAVGGTPEIVNNENGVLLPANPTPEYIAEKINKFYNLSETEIKKKREVAYKTWNEKLNADKNYNKFVEGILKF